MNKHVMLFLTVLITTALVLGACGPRVESSLAPAPAATETAVPAQPTDQPTSQPVDETSGRVSFEMLGISMEIPSELSVVKEPTINLDDPSKLQGYLFYIENDWPPGAPVEEYFQMYGHLQFNPQPTGWEEYKNNVLNSDMFEYAREIEINGLPGIDSQYSGQRNRYVYHFPLDDQILSIAVSHPTEENKALADEIISSLEFNPGTLTDESGVQLVSEPNGYYQMYLPEDWQIEFKAPAGIRLSDLQASSPDAEVVIEETDGPHSNIYYKGGVNLNIAILEDNSALSGPVMAQIISETPLKISGIEGNEYVFTEPSTKEGEIREIRYYFYGLSYLVRFSYGPGADQQEIDWLIRNFQINQSLE